VGMKRKKVNWIIKGAGDSFWGNSSGEYNVTKIELKTSDWDPNWGELIAYGPNLRWFQYTDTHIDEEMEKLVKTVFPKVTDVYWSEQGMQPDDGWSFDVELLR